MSDIRMLVWVGMLWAGATGLHAQATSQETTTTVRGRVEVIGVEGKAKTRRGAISRAVVWLTPMTGGGGDVPSLPARLPANPRVVRKDKSFDPHNLVGPVRSIVEVSQRGSLLPYACL